MFLKKLFDPSRKLLKKAKNIAKKVLALENEYKLLKDEDFPRITNEYKAALKAGKTTLEELVVPAFALVREASSRVTGLTPFFVQIAGAYIIHGGNIAEMKTGEGKTLTAVMPAYLNALTEQGVHIVTVNEYLATREAKGEIGKLFEFLGLSVGLNLSQMESQEKQAAYECDILYSTNSELGFDYLRDNISLYKEDLVGKRGLNFAIIDEVDSILIDEARTPLIISGGAKDDTALYRRADAFSKSLSDEDYIIDIEDKAVELSESGMSKAERYFGVQNLYDISQVGLLHRINNAMRANYIMARDKDYVVADNKVLIVDQFTGRILDGRQFSEGLHQALEAKENVKIKQETVTVATITYQNFFRMYKKLAGMTGTAKTEEEEFKEIYNMLVVEVPTNVKVERIDATDLLFASASDKFKALLDEVQERHEKGQPILIGTIAVETSEYLSQLLTKRGIKHEVLNAKQHEREAEIIKNAGLVGAVTIATNMAGRGTDIKLGPGVKELGGLAVIGSERHESRRIDNQLRGRSGRQGDPGYSRFYISADDELLQRFSSETFKNRVAYMQGLQQNKNSDLEYMPPIESKMFSYMVTNAQKKVEGMNCDSRKNVLKYDDVMRIQRETIYAEREAVIKNQDVQDLAYKILIQYLKDITFDRLYGQKKGQLNTTPLFKYLDGNIFKLNAINFDILKQKQSLPEIEKYLQELADKEIQDKIEKSSAEEYNEFLKVIILRTIDTYWMEHIDRMQGLRQAVSLQGYAQQNPVIVYQNEGKKMFLEMLDQINEMISRYILRAVVERNTEREEVAKNAQANQATDYKFPQKQPKASKKNKPWQ